MSATPPTVATPTPGAVFRRVLGGLAIWLTIVRFGLVQGSVAAITVLPLTTLPRLIQNELGLFALFAGALVAVYYGAQVSRLFVGAFSDIVGRRTVFVIAGLAILSVSGVAASLSVGLMERDLVLGTTFAALSYMGVGLGVGTAGTALLTILTLRVPPALRAPAATVVWFLMIACIVATAIAAGIALSPFSFARLAEVAVAVSLASFAIGTLCVLGIERRGDRQRHSAEDAAAPAKLTRALATLREPATRQFAIFVLVATLAYNMQELVFEAFFGDSFGLDAGQSTKLSGLHRAGILGGLVITALVGRAVRGRPGALVALTVAGCLGSAAALAALGTAALIGPGFPLTPTVIAFGVANGMFAGGALAAMFGLAGSGETPREGTRMGAFGLAQATGFGTGMFLGAAIVDAMMGPFGPAGAYAAVFYVEAAVFTIAAVLAVKVIRTGTAQA